MQAHHSETTAPPRQPFQNTQTLTHAKPSGRPLAINTRPFFKLKNRTKIRFVSTAIKHRSQEWQSYVAYNKQAHK